MNPYKRIIIPAIITLCVVMFFAPILLHSCIEQEDQGGPVPSRQAYGISAPVGSLQYLYVDVATRYGVTAQDGMKRVSDKYAAGADTLSTGLNWAWKRWRVEGMPYATFRSTYLGAAIIKDVAWNQAAAGEIASGYQNPFSFADFSRTHGKWKINRTTPLPRGGLIGSSSFGYWDGQTDQVFATTEFEMVDAEWWPAGPVAERRMFETPNSSLSTPDNGSYNESMRVENIRMTGPAIYGDGINRIGMFVRRGGECFYGNQLQANHFTNGIVFNGGVPVTLGTVTAFMNEKCGVGLYGCWGMTFAFQTISGDQNGELLGSHPGYGDEAGGRISGQLLKDEDGLHTETARSPYRWQTALYLEGQYTATIGVISTARGFITQDAMILLNPRLKNGTPQGSVLNVGSAIGFNYRTVVHNLMTGERIASPGDYQGFSLRHYANGNRYVLNDQVVTPTGCNCPPLGGIKGSGNYNYTACTPLKPGGTTTPPAPGTWTCTGWSACLNGTQTRTCTCAGDCATVPKPAESQTCTVTPPPTTMTASASVNNVAAELAKITDGNAGTFWMAGVSMAVGQWVQVDYGVSASRTSVSIDIAQGYLNSYPRTFDVQVSTNGTSWTTAKAGAVGAYPTCTVTFPAVSFRYARATVRTANPNWLAIAGWR